MRKVDRFRGCLIGGAAGDALGYAVEFMQDTEIFRRYGADGITEYDLTGEVAQISDDTQMTLFTATGLLLGTTRGMIRGIMGPYSGYIGSSYQDWLKTQEERYPLPDEYHYSWLVDVPELFSRRAPGGTCLSALRAGGSGTIEHPINNSKGCGGVMRVAPIGLYFNDRRMDIEKIDRIGAEAAAIPTAMNWVIFLPQRLSILYTVSVRMIWQSTRQSRTQLKLLKPCGQRQHR